MARRTDPQQHDVYAWERAHVMPHDEIADRGPAPRAKDFITCPALRACVDLREWSSIRWDDLTNDERKRFNRAVRAYNRGEYAPALGYMTLDEIHELAVRCMKRWHVGVSLNVDATSGRSAHANAYHMSFPRWARRRSVALHEIAHVISDRCWHTYSHGPEFMAVYVDLCHTYMGLSKRELRRTCKDYGITIQPGAYCYGGRHPRTVNADWK